MLESLTPGDDLEPEDGGEDFADGWYEIATGIRELLSHEKIVDAVASYLNSLTAKNTEARSPVPYYFSLGFGLLIFAGIAFLAWKKILDSQSTVVLIGALIAAWYGGQRQQPQK
jgi:hypothetical protein